MICSDSLRRPTRWSRPSMPYISCSISFHAAPIPNSSRPPERWSTVTASLASTTGCRYVLPVTMQPMRARFVASAIAACSAHPSYTGPPGPLGPIDARWSKSQTWSKPPSSAIFQHARSSSIELHWPEALSPNRSGCVMGPPSVPAQAPHADPVRIAPRKLLGRPAEALDLVAVLADVGPDLVRRRFVLDDPGLAGDADNGLAGLVGVQVQLDVGVLLHVACLDARRRVDEE